MKASVYWNVCFIVVTLLVSQLSCVLNVVLDLKSSDMSSTRDVSHPDMCPCIAVAAASSATHASTACLRSFAEVYRVHGPAGGGGGCAGAGGRPGGGGDGVLDGFPQYPLPRLQLSAEQATALFQLSGWCLLQRGEALKEALLESYSERIERAFEFGE